MIKMGMYVDYDLATMIVGVIIMIMVAMMMLIII